MGILHKGRVALLYDDRMITQWQAIATVASQQANRDAIVFTSGGQSLDNVRAVS